MVHKQTSSVKTFRIKIEYKTGKSVGYVSSTEVKLSG